MFAQLFVVFLVGRTSTLLIAGDESVHHSVGIAAYGRCEVSVVVECQSEVSDVVDGVLSLHHGTQSHGLYEVLLALALTSRHKRVERLSQCALRSVGLHLVSELHYKLAQRFQLRRVGIVVYTIGQSLGLFTLCHLADRFSHRSVGEQHKLLDELVGILRVLEVAAYRLALFVYIEVKFLAVELHGSVLEACRAQLLCQTVELNECVGILATVSSLRSRRSRIARSVHNAVVLKQLLHLLVGVAAVRLYYGVNDAILLHVGVVVEIEDDGECQLLLVGAQRADEVAQTFGQHRYGAVDEIYTRGTLHSLLVYHRTLLDVVAHVGYVYAYLPKSVLKLLYRQRVVEVLGVLRVDGAGESVAEVLAFGIVFGCYLS